MKKPEAETTSLVSYFPAVLDIPLTFQLTMLELTVTERFGDGAPPRRRMLTATWEWSAGPKHRVRVHGDVDVTSVGFDPNGNPTDRAKWAALVKSSIDEALQDAGLRIEELVELGLSAEAGGDA